MLDLISVAYAMDSRKVVGGPSWLDQDRFDIIAGAPPATSQDTGLLMLQSLLAERFKLALHKDTKPMPAFVLSLGKGKPKMKESKDEGPSSCQGQSQPNVAPIAGAPTVVLCRNMTMAALADNLQGLTSGTYLPNAVIDETGLKGAWDFELKWHARNQLAAAGSEGLTIFDAVEKQLGLKLEPQQRPQPVLVIDSVNRSPTPNAADVTGKLPPAPPAEFEIATIKLSTPGGPQRGNVQNGRVDLEGLTLKNLIRIAWDLNNNDQLIAGLPKFADSKGFSITAKAPIPEGAKTEQEVDDYTLRLMLRNLLAERFQLKTHMEDRPVEGYVISAVKPKLEKADVSNRTECKEGPGKDGKDPRNTVPILNRLMTCTNMTMAQFAEQLPILVNGYVRTAVLDATELEGAWDFTLSFSGVNLYRNNTPESPNGALSLSDATSKQLGLKLDLQKRSMPVLVIDRLEETFTEN